MLEIIGDPGTYSAEVVGEVLERILRRPVSGSRCPRAWLGERIRVQADGRVDRVDFGMIASIRFPPLRGGGCAWIAIPDPPAVGEWREIRPR